MPKRREIAGPAAACAEPQPMSAQSRHDLERISGVSRARLEHARESIGEAERKRSGHRISKQRGRSALRSDRRGIVRRGRAAEIARDRTPRSRLHERARPLIPRDCDPRADWTAAAVLAWVGLHARLYDIQGDQRLRDCARLREMRAGL